MFKLVRTRNVNGWFSRRRLAFDKPNDRLQIRHLQPIHRQPIWNFWEQPAQRIRRETPYDIPEFFLFDELSDCDAGTLLVELREQLGCLRTQLTVIMNAHPLLHQIVKVIARASQIIVDLRMELIRAAMSWSVDAIDRTG